MSAMEIRDLVVEVEGYPVVDGLTLTVEEGEKVGIVGDYHDAVTVLHVLTGLLLPTSGEVWIYNLPARQAYQRGLIRYISSSTLNSGVLSAPTPVLAATFLPASTTNAGLLLFIAPNIDFPDKFLEKDYKLVWLKRGETRHDQ